MSIPWVMICANCDAQLAGGAKRRPDQDDEWHRTHCVSCGLSEEELKERDL